ncbi:heavy metal translocating P-type ATPase [Azonexus sp.]|uniref:heavy metal translocating P-type ATPase n=1 Tax=Azonexus sp. TaxID=1872668 RepID=UPI0027BAFB11|nr:heavy metal translocating P-type ATPase [Azonexus sp.]
MSQASCYHCGLPVPDDVDLPVVVNGESRTMCCYGCQAVAQSIVDNGLADYYRSRDALPESPREAMPAILEQMALFDHADFQKSFVKELGEGEREASLLLEGITCAACIWLNEQHIGKLPGVTAVNINYTTRRAKVRWDESRIKLSDILRAVAAIGYRAYPYDAAKSEEISRSERRGALWRLWVAGFGMMQVMMYAYPVYIANGDMTVDIETLMRWASLILTLPVVFYSSAPFFRNAWRDLKLLRVGMDVPVALGVGVAFAASCWATLLGGGEVYFDSVTMFVFFLLGGRYLEMTARQKALSVTEALTKMLPAFAQKVPNFPVDRETEQKVVADLQVGDYVLVRPGDIVPADGRVVEGVSCANEALLTGESLPVPKQPGDSVTGGSINAASPLVVQVEQVGQSTRLSAIISLMERASLEKPKIVELADRIASYFVGSLLLIAILTALGWYFVEPSKALWITVSVLVVTCPCALSLATPIALTVAAGALARDGLLVTRGHAIETLARATHFVFDKTGTLTSGQMCLRDVRVFGAMPAGECLNVAAALEQASEHPLAMALRHAASGDMRYQSIDSLSEPGQGIEGVINGRCYRIGRPAYALSLSGGELPSSADDWLESGDTVVLLADAEGCLALFRIGDELRLEAKGLVADLRASGKHVVLLTGDAPAVARRVAGELGIEDVRAGVTPAGKHDCVKALQAAGAVVAMIGDGVNDAPVLAQAQVSVAMGGGAQLARTQSDFVLLSENLSHLRTGLLRAAFSLVVIRQNLWWSFAYNFVALPAAIAGYVTPWMAGIGMSLSSLLVVLNSLRIQRMEND